MLGVDVTSLARVADAMELALRGHGYAKSVLEVACWDLLGKIVDVPCHVLLGGLRQERFPLYVAVPLGASRGRWPSSPPVPGRRGSTGSS